jgi:hypothetical protein
MLQDIEYIGSWKYVCVCLVHFVNKYGTIILANYNQLRVLYCSDYPLKTGNLLRHQQVTR